VPGWRHSARRATVSPMQPTATKIAWRRGDGGATYLGSVSRGPEAIRLSGRDAVLGIDVTLSVPIDEIEYVGVSEPADDSAGAESCVIVDLAGSEPIYLRPLGSTKLHVHLLARALGALTVAPTVLAQGGRS
jgi:hypothetical protein